MARARASPNKYPALAAEAADARARRAPGPLHRPARGRRARGDRQRARSGHKSRGTAYRSRSMLAVDAWRERMRAHADAACRHLIVNERKEAGASLPHTHAQLYALDFVPAAVARERERFGAYAVRTMGGNLLGDYVQEEVRRRERIVAIDDEAVLMAPVRLARARTTCILAPRRAAGALRGRRPERRRAAARRAAAPARAARREPAAEPLGPHRAQRRRALLLADRDPAAADAPGRARARHRRAPVHRARPSRPRPSCASCESARPARQPRQRHRRRHGHRRDRPRPARPARRHAHRHAGRRRPARREGPQPARLRRTPTGA